MWNDLLGSWSGVLSVVVILLSALAIPGAILVALLRQHKGPVELAQQPKPLPAARHSDWYESRYSH